MLWAFSRHLSCTQEYVLIYEKDIKRIVLDKRIILCAHLCMCVCGGRGQILNGTLYLININLNIQIIFIYSLFCT